VLTVTAGSRLSFELAAADEALPSAVRIRAAGPLPTGMRLVPSDGSPATAVVAWTPGGAQLGDVPIAFAASDEQGLVSPTVTYVVRVRARPDRAQLFHLSGVGSLSRWAAVLRPVVARSAPAASAPQVTRVDSTTSDGTQNVVLLLDSLVRGTSVWVRVRLPVLPNNRTAWIPRSALGDFHSVTTHLYVDTRRATAVLYRDGRTVFRTTVGVGRTYWPTPRGEFYIRDKLVGFGDPFYGPVAFGTSARSAVLTDWPDGGYIGIHGTNQPELLPGRVSHGCIRMRNEAILRLARLMPVGTPLTVT
jgi:hypothetical protein